MATTPNVNLPLIDGSATADVPRDVNALAVAVDTVIGSLDGGSSAATPNTLIKRDGAGRAKVAVPSAADDIARKDTVDDAVNAINADYVRQPGYAVTAGTGNAYTVSTTPAPAAYVDGMGIVIRANRANTGASTLKWDTLAAVPIVDAKGIVLTAGKIPNGARLSLRYSSAVGNFQLQGEGGGGNATAADLLAGKTASVDSGDIVGTMPNRGGWTTALGPYPANGTLEIEIPEGAYTTPSDTANPKIVIDDFDFTPANIPANKNIFGMQGTIPVRTGTEGSAGEANGIGDITLTPPTGIYNGSTSKVKAFDADFIPANFPSNKNIFGMQGTMPNKPFHNNPRSVFSGGGETGALYVRIDPGAYVTNDIRDGSLVSEFHIHEPNFLSSNIALGMTMFGLTGTGATVKKSASGRTTSGSSPLSFTCPAPANYTINMGVLTVSGLGFTPSKVLICAVSSNRYTVCYPPTGVYGGGRILSGEHNPSNSSQLVTSTFLVTGNAYLILGGFRMPVPLNNAAFDWFAIE